MKLTPEQRASTVVVEYHAKRAWGYDPNQHAEYESLIADAIRAAELEARTEQRELDAALVETFGKPPTAGGVRATIAAAIRSTPVKGT